MSVDPAPLEQQTKHYGSAYAMTDYETNSINLYLNASYSYSPRLMLFGSVLFNQSKAELDQVIMPDVTARLFNEFTGTTDLTHQDFTFDEMHEYSDLDYQLLGFSLGFEYELSLDLNWTADGQYYDLTDNKGYVYGDESGPLLMVRSGLQFEF